MRNIHVLLLFCCTMTFLAHEFVQKQKPKRITLSMIKDQYGDLFAEQLRETASIVELLGGVQSIPAVEINKDAQLLASLKQSAVKLHTYHLQLGDLLHPVKAVQSVLLFDNKNVSELVACITTMVGKIQQQLIAYISDLIDDTGDLFVKKHLEELSDQLSVIKEYTKELSLLKKVLFDVKRALKTS